MEEENRRDRAAITERYEFRMIRPEEADQAIEIENICFPGLNAVTPEEITARVVKTPDTFFVAADRETGKLTGFLTAVRTDEEVMDDSFFTDPGRHDPKGKKARILGLDILPKYRKQGIARELITRYLRFVKETGGQSVALDCLDEKVGMYEKMGFVKNGISPSQWAGSVWNEMICRF